MIADFFLCNILWFWVLPFACEHQETSLQMRRLGVGAIVIYVVMWARVKWSSRCFWMFEIKATHALLFSVSPSNVKLDEKTRKRKENHIDTRTPTMAVVATVEKTFAIKNIKVRRRFCTRPYRSHPVLMQKFHPVKTKNSGNRKLFGSFSHASTNLEPFSISWGCSFDLEQKYLQL